MNSRTVRTPGPDHPITIAPNPNRVVVRLGEHVLADSRHALTLREASYPAVHYLPQADVDMAALVRSATASYCPYKGDASYFGLPAGGSRGTDVAWSYEAPFEACAAIAGYLAFYPDRVDAIEERPA